jgi:two-component system sensor histidine kinase EvgS
MIFRIKIASVFMLLLSPFSEAACPTPEVYPIAMDGDATLFFKYKDMPVAMRSDKSQIDVRMGVLAPGHAPFEVFGAEGISGISIDVMRAMRKVTNGDLSIKVYKQAECLLDDMALGRLDILAMGTTALLHDRLSKSDKIGTFSDVFLDSPIIVSGMKSYSGIDGASRNNKQVLYSSNVKIAHTALVSSNYIESTTGYRPLSSDFMDIQLAFDSVFFGPNDLLLSDIYSFRFLNEARYGAMQPMDTFGDRKINFSFFVSKKNEPLLSRLNYFMGEFEKNSKSSLISRWFGGIPYSYSMFPIYWSPKERSWIDSKEVIVGFNVNDSPYTFIDYRGDISGISIDILNALSEISGMKFYMVKFDDDSALNKALHNGTIDVVAALPMILNDRYKIKGVTYNSEDAMVLLIPFDKLDADGNFAGESIALDRDYPFPSEISEALGGLNLRLTKSGDLSIKSMVDGKVDGAAVSLHRARYFLSESRNASKYRILKRIGERGIDVGFAFKSDKSMAYSVFKKALSSIPPSQLLRYSSSWKMSPSYPSSSIIQRYDNIILYVLVSFLVVTLLYAAKFMYLKRLLRERNQAANELNEQLVFIRELINSLPHPLQVRDTNGILIYCNDSFVSIIAVDKDRVIGESISDSIRWVLSEAVELEQTYRRVIRGGESIIRELELTFYGEKKYMYEWTIPYKDINGNVKGIISGWIDLTSRKALEDELLDAKNMADRANLAKSIFLASMSHEIRTPMNSIIGFIELVLNSGINSVTDRESLKMAMRASHGLLDLIGDILDISSIESGAIRVVAEDVFIKDFVSSVVDMTVSLAKKKELKLSFISDLDNADVACKIDPVRLRQIILNVVNNALKFTFKGSVTVRLTIVDSMIYIRIRDTGIGIPSDKINDAFKPFSQLHDNINAGYEGTGLGLVISKTLAELMGGGITLSSIEGQGTEVCINIPFIKADNLDAVKIYNSVHHDIEIIQPEVKLTFLIIDDHPSNRILLKKQLEYLHQKVILAENGRDGFNKWMDESPDIIITDCQMPEIDGYQFSKMIRSAEADRGLPSVVIIGFTASGLMDDYDACLAAGMNDCLFKPIGLARLTDIVKKYSALLPEDHHLQLDDVNLSVFGDSEEANKFIAELISINDSDYSELCDAISTSDVEVALSRAHRIKGVGQIMVNRDIVDICEMLESGLKFNKFEVDVKIMLDRLRIIMDKMKKELSAKL